MVASRSFLGPPRSGRPDVTYADPRPFIPSRKERMAGESISSWFRETRDCFQRPLDLFIG
jgi:hypothetical protein